MKHIKILYIVLITLFFCNSCENKGISLGEQTLVGKIVGLGTPPAPSKGLPPPPCTHIGFETDMWNYYVMIDSHLICGEEKFIVENIEYSINEGVEVEIIGEVTVWRNPPREEYFIIEIETIKKLP